MKQHLIDIVEELKLEGYSESDAVDIAIKRFGNPATLKKDVERVLTKKCRKLKKTSKYILVVIIGILIAMTFGVYIDLECNAYMKTRIDKIKDTISSFEIELPLKENEIEFLDDLTTQVIPHNIKYLRLYRIVDATEGEDIIDTDTLFNLNVHEEFDDKKLIEAYAFGTPKHSINQVQVYNKETMRWYAEYEVDKFNCFHRNIYYFSQCAIFLIFIATITIYVNKELDKCRLKYNYKKM